MGCKLSIKFDLDKALRDLSEDFAKTISGYYGAFVGAASKLTSLSEAFSQVSVSKIINSTVSQIKEIGADIKSGAIWLTIQLIKKTGQLLPRLLVAKALLSIRDDLDKRVAIMNELEIQLNIVSTCLLIIKNNTFFNDNRERTIAQEIARASHFVKQALIQSRNFISIWANTGVYHDGVFRKIIKNLNAAQSALMIDELETYQTDLEHLLGTTGLRDLEASGIIDIESLLDSVAGNLDVSNRGVRALLALEPLYSYLNSGITDRISRVIFAFKLGLQAVLEISKLTPYSPEILWSILKASGHTVAQGPENYFDNIQGNEDYFNRYVDLELDTLLELNGVINNKIQAMQHIEDKLITLDQVTSPLVSYVDESTVGLRAIHDDMRETLATRTETRELLGRRAAWSNEIADIQFKLQALPPIVGTTLEFSTEWVKDWNEALTTIDNIDLTGNPANSVYISILTTLVQMPVAFTSRAQSEAVTSNIAVIKRKIRISKKEDRLLIKQIDDLQLDKLEGLELVDQLIEFADAAFPLLGEILRNADIDKLNKALSEVKIAFVSNLDDVKKALKKTGDALKWIKEAEVLQNLNKCLSEIGVDVDIDLSFSFSDKGDEETDKDLAYFTNFEEKNKGALKNMSKTFDKSIYGQTIT